MLLLFRTDRLRDYGGAGGWKPDAITNVGVGCLRIMGGGGGSTSATTIVTAAIMATQAGDSLAR